MRTRWENTTENGQLCRALRKTVWTRPLGTTAGAPEDRPGDLRTGTGVDRRDFSPGGRLPPTENKQTKQRREALDEPDASPRFPPPSPPLLLGSPPPVLSSSLLSSLFFSSSRRRKKEQRHTGNVAARRVGFIRAVAFFFLFVVVLFLAPTGE